MSQARVAPRLVASWTLILLSIRGFVCFISIITPARVTLSQALPSSSLAHSTMPAVIEELRTWKRAEPTTRKRKRPSTIGPTGIFSSLVYDNTCEWMVVMRDLLSRSWRHLLSWRCFARKSEPSAFVSCQVQPNKVHRSILSSLFKKPSPSQTEDTHFVLMESR